MMKVNTTLPDGSADRKKVPMFRGLLGYFPAALMGVAQHSQMGNDKHNPGEELHHARGKSMDHADCVIRHLMDIADIKAADARGDIVDYQQLLEEANALCWRALALSQEVYESIGAPLAPGARYPDTPRFDMARAIAEGWEAEGQAAQGGVAGNAAEGGPVEAASSSERLVGFDRGRELGIARGVIQDTGTPGVELDFGANREPFDPAGSPAFDPTFQG